MESGSAYTILDLKDNISFKCYPQKVVENYIKEYRCVLPLVPKDLFSIVKTDFFNISYEVKKRKFILKIVPKKRVQAFPLTSNNL